jgi:DNA-binding MarR family transcriptional regulator
MLAGECQPVVSGVSKRAHLSLSTASGTAYRLEKNDLIERRRSPEDRCEEEKNKILISLERVGYLMRNNA